MIDPPRLTTGGNGRTLFEIEDACIRMIVLIKRRPSRKAKRNQLPLLTDALPETRASARAWSPRREANVDVAEPRGPYDHHRHVREVRHAGSSASEKGIAPARASRRRSCGRSHKVNEVDGGHPIATSQGRYRTPSQRRSRLRPSSSWPRKCSLPNDVPSARDRHRHLP